MKKDAKPRQQLNYPIRETCSKFNEENPNIVSLSKFGQLNPVNVKPMTKHELNQCLCSICTNIELKLKTVNRVTGMQIKSKYELCNLTLCEKGPEDTYHIRQCIERNCQNCGTGKLFDLMKTMNDTGKNFDRECQWVQWNEKVDSESYLKTFTGSVWILIERFIEDLEAFPLHLFTKLYVF